MKSQVIIHGRRTTYIRRGCRCKPCTEANRLYEVEHGGSRRATRRKHGCEDISEQDCKALLKKQGGKCAICRKELVWPSKGTHVDHNHKTGRVRGVLCNNCNRGLGSFQDDPEILTSAARYARKHK